MVDISKLPLFKDIPPVKGMPCVVHGCAWGLFDKNGEKDDLGTLNLLTPEVVAKAGSEIQTGHSVALNWSLDRLHKAGFGRITLEHQIIDWKKEYGADMWCFDDIVKINTQTGSQWDGLRHWGHSDTGLYYNGTHHNDLLASGRLGIDAWSKRGGIAGRGILLDYVAYTKRHGIEYSAMSAQKITMKDIQGMIREQNLEQHPGDLLLVRSGWVKWYEEHTQEEREKYITNGNAWVGVEGCEEVAEWLWNSRISAVAGDSIGFEVWPSKAPWKLHDVCLSMWGMPIGEMWDLESLAAECERQKRWSFFITSAPLNTPGVASPPNAIAVF